MRSLACRPRTEPQLSRAAPESNSASATGRYQVLNQIATGGMGAVYRVRDRVTGELQALKRAGAQGSERHFALEALALEYQVLASLDHPRIIRVFDYGVDADGPYYTMELLEGQDFRHAVVIPYRTACSYLRDIATSLALLHGRRLLHRDLSPGNVRVTPDGHCKLLDFGALATFGVTTRIVGTTPLIAPEALAREALDQRTDLYALGGLAYWMLTARHAYPARELSQLPDHWAEPVLPPSQFASDIPPELDALVLALLARDPLARPSTAAEVIARLGVTGELLPEDSEQTARLAESFFASPRFTGRAPQLRELRAAIDATVGGQGSAVRIEAVPGMGRTRLLDEIAVLARVSGVTVLFADANMSPQLQGTAQSLVSRLFELLPELAHEFAPAFRVALLALGHGLPALSFAREPAAGSDVNGARPLAELFAEISNRRPLLIEVDNIEDADDASHGLLASLANLADRHPILLVVSEARTRARSGGLGSTTLRRLSRTLELESLAHDEMLELLHSIFADAPSLERFADWVHGRTAGSPLHAIEICRRLLATGVVRYENGLWSLPNELPDAELPAALGDALSIRLNTLREPARKLAESLGLQRNQPTLALCTALCADAEDPNARARELLEELAKADVLHADRNGYRFSSSALRAALLHDVKGEALLAQHRRLGAAFEQLASDDDLAMRMEAGFHLIAGEEELRGAELIASVTHDSTRLRALTSNLHHVGNSIEAALKVYRRHRRSIYERLPLLCALAEAGYYENRYFGEQYGDDALDALELVSGLATARQLRPYLGRVLSLAMGVLLAFARFAFVPRRLRRYSFFEVFQQLFASVMALSGTAALSLDAERCDAVASVIEPFACLPERSTPAGVYQVCSSLREIALENEAAAYAKFELLLKRFSDPRCYPSLTPEGRRMIVSGVHFARGSFAVFRARGEAALQSADALQATGYKLYAMIASQLRFLYYTARGEFAKAAPHRIQVELHATHVGSVWQVETWEAAALLLIHVLAIGDVVNGTRLAHRLEALAESVPSLRRYARLANSALIAAHGDKRYLEAMADQHTEYAPRSFIGWAATQGAAVRSYNQLGEFALAKQVGERALAHVVDDDRESVALFLSLDLQFAVALAGLGDVAAGLDRIDRLIARFEDCDHPLLQGMLHETRAHVCWQAKRFEEYQHSLNQVERAYRATGTPALIAKYEQLASLANVRHTVRPGQPANSQDVDDLETVAAVERSSRRSSTD